MSKFKVGDKLVRVCAGGGQGQLKVGQIVTATEVDDGYVLTTGNEEFWLHEERFAIAPEEKTIITAESLRTRFLEIEKEEEEISNKIDELSQEKSKIEDDLRVMGFILCSPTQEDFMPILDETPSIDYNDWRNWKKGDVVECVSDDGWDGSFVSGSLYTVSDRKETGVWVESDAGEEYVSNYIDDFKFHSPF